MRAPESFLRCGRQWRDKQRQEKRRHKSGCAFAHGSGRLRTNEGDDAECVVKTEYHHHHQYPLVPEAPLAPTVKMPMESQRSSNQEEPHTERESEQVVREAEGTLAAITPAAAAVEEEQAHAWRAAEAIARLFKRTKHAKETFAEFAHALGEIGSGCRIGEELFVTAFIAGVGDEFTAALLRVVAPQTLSKAAQEASRLRDTDGAQKSKRARKSRHQRERGRKHHNDSSGFLVEAVVSKKPVTLRSRDDASPLRKVEAVPPLKPAVEDVKLAEDDGSADSLSRKKKRTACFECEAVGHFRRECPQRARRL